MNIDEGKGIEKKDFNKVNLGDSVSSGVMKKSSAFEKFKRVLVTMLLIIIAFFGGWYFGKNGYVYEIRKNPPKIEIINRYPDDQEVDFGLFWEVWKILQNEYLERPVDGQKMLYGAIKGMVESLDDPYTSYLPPKVYKSVHDAINGTYEGIGAELGMEDGQLIVVAPLDGSPAKAAGLLPGDRITKIEDESTIGVAITEAVGKIRGEAGTIVNLTIQRGDEAPKQVTIKRGRITISSVSWEDKGDGIVYIRLSRFGVDTNKDWDEAVKEINVGMQNIDAIILDVRGNPGGYLLSAVHISGDFFRDKVVVYQESSIGELSPYDTTRVGSFEKIPVYVLIDEGSASASEILAAALRDNIGAILVGQKSFGKGTIQEAQNFDDGSGLHMTVAKWLTPEKEWVHKVGLMPDKVVERKVEDMQNGYDAQLEKALEFAKQGIIDVEDIPDDEPAEGEDSEPTSVESTESAE